MLEKAITIGDKQVKFRSSATIPRLYRAKFKRDIFKTSHALNHPIRVILMMVHPLRSKT